MQTLPVPRVAFDFYQRQLAFFLILAVLLLMIRGGISAQSSRYDRRISDSGSGGPVARGPS